MGEAKRQIHDTVGVPQSRGLKLPTVDCRCVGGGDSESQIDSLLSRFLPVDEGI